MKPAKDNKNKRPRVLANTVKRPERSANSSGNRSFFNKSTNHYVNDLRNNNAKLAHSLASEKRKVSEIFRRYNDNQNELLREQARSRAVSDMIRTGCTQLNNALDLLCQATQSFYNAQNIVRPQSGGDTATILHASAAPIIHQGKQEAAQTPFSGVPCSSEQSNTTIQVSCQGGNEPRATTSIVKKCTTRPMIQGQVISNPTISLQRVAVPPRYHLGKGKVKPARGALLECNFPSRLSEISEQINESSESRSSLERLELNHNSTSGSSSNSVLPDISISLPPPHVVLERMSAENGSVPSAQSLNCDIDDEHHTVVHFGRVSYSAETQFRSNNSHPEPFTQARTCDTVVACSGSSFLSGASVKPALSNSDEFESESSSEDENLALQIAESKKSYLEGNRRVEFKEGTSWNYDEKGKFCKRPPRRKRTAKASKQQGKGFAVPDSKSKRSKQLAAADLGKAHESVLKLQPEFNDFIDDTNQKRKSKTPPKQRCSLTSVQSPKIPAFLGGDSPKAAASANQDNLTSPQDCSTTILEAVDMSFTCVTPPHKDMVSQLHQLLISPSAPKCSEIVLLEDRQAYVTQRSRKAPSQKSASLRDKSLSPVSSSPNSKANCINGTRDITPSPELSMCDKNHAKATVLNNHYELTQKPSYVLLERLPSNYCGSKYISPFSNHEDNSSPSRKSDSVPSPNHKCNAMPKRKPGPASSSNRNISSKMKLGPKRDKCESDSDTEESLFDLHMNRRKRTCKVIASSSEDDESDDYEALKARVKPKYKPGPKRHQKSKEKMQDSKSFGISEDEPPSENAQSLSTTSSAALSASASTSPVAASDSLSASHWADSSTDAARYRPRRNAAPLNMKEPKLGSKLRRP